MQAIDKLGFEIVLCPVVEPIVDDTQRLVKYYKSVESLSWAPSIQSSWKIIKNKKLSKFMLLVQIFLFREVLVKELVLGLVASRNAGRIPLFLRSSQ